MAHADREDPEPMPARRGRCRDLLRRLLAHRRQSVRHEEHDAHPLRIVPHAQRCAQRAGNIGPAPGLEIVHEFARPAHILAAWPTV